MNTLEIRLPQALEDVFAAHTEPESIFRTILPVIGEVMQVDRCFLHVRNPQTRMYRSFCWRRSEDLPDTTTNGWEQEAEWEQEDPMFAAALRCAFPIFVEDVETASPKVLNIEFERKHLGHRALVHSHICEEGKLWGILQPAVYGHSRMWSGGDRTLIEQLLERLKPYILSYVKEST